MVIKQERGGTSHQNMFRGTYGKTRSEREVEVIDIQRRKQIDCDKNKVSIRSTEDRPSFQED